MIIAIKGCNGVGKSTAAEILQKLLGRGFIHNFSTIPNKMYQILTGIDYSQLDRIEKEKVRPDFINFCEEMKKYRGSNVFANALMSKYQNVSKGHYPDPEFSFFERYWHTNCKHCKQKYVGFKRQFFCSACIDNPEVTNYQTWIIPDLRFQSEYDAIQEKAERFLVLNICRENCFENITDLDPQINNYTIYNNGTIEDLEVEIIKFLDYFKIRTR